MLTITPGRIFIAITFLLSMLLLPTSSPIHAVTFEIQSDKSRVRFEIGHYEYAKPVKGRFGSVVGVIELPAGETAESDAQADTEAPSIEVVIDAASVDTDNTFRDSHLRSAFFEVDEFPSIRFTVKGENLTAAGLRSGEERVIEGSLTMKGVTRPVELVVEAVRETTDTEGRRILRCRLHGRLNRHDFGVEEDAAETTGLSRILAQIQEGMDEFIEDDVEIAITVVARESVAVIAGEAITVVAK